MGIQHIPWTTAHATDEEQIRSEFVFCMVDTSRNKGRTGERRTSLPVSQKIAECLRAKSSSVSKVWSGSAPGTSGFDVRLDAFEVTFVLELNLLKESGNRYHGTTWCSRPLWKHPSPQDVFDGWNGVCDNIELVLKENPPVESLQRLKKDEVDFLTS